MKKIHLRLLTVLMLFLTQLTTAQILTPVKWSFSTKQLDNNQFDLVLSANIEKGWHLYSPYLESDQGPIATSFTFNKNSDVQLVGKIKEGKPKEMFDKNFEMNVRYFEGQPAFTQRVKVLKPGKTKITGMLTYQVCDESRCLPPEDVEFSFEVEGKNVTPEKTEIDGTTTNPDTAAVAPIDIDSGTTVNPQKTEEKLVPAKYVAPSQSSLSLWAVFIKGFLGGLLALLTPCVFPMIPLTVSFFTKQSKTRHAGIINAWIYGLSIIFIYVTLGMIITLSLGPDALNAMASHAFFNLAFFLIFMVFAFSFLGAFEIRMPSSWVNKADSASERGGLMGIFFMAFTLSLVSFSCTGPIIGTLLVDAAIGGNFINPVLGMGGFAVALALPFGLFAAFPGWLNSLPKSGGWLNSIKVVLGLLELAMAFKFLSNVDLAYHWGFLTRELFLAIWIIIFSILGLYLLGFIRFSHDTELPYLTIPRLMFAIITFAFVIYLIPGMFGAPLKMISGFPPPQFYTEGWSLGQGSKDAKHDGTLIPGTDPEHCPHNLNCFHDYETALAYAKQVNKPLMVDFTGWSCVNCRKMEDNVWVDPRVLNQLKNDYVLVSLYVDDKTPLPKEEQFTSQVTGKKIRTTGNKWSNLQTTRFKTNSQPYYVLLDHNEVPLLEPSGYNSDIGNYALYLKKGVEVFKQRSSQDTR
jgi:thiol:disulfide interchange protein DsbD